VRVFTDHGLEALVVEVISNLLESRYNVFGFARPRLVQSNHANGLEGHWV